MSKVTVSKSFSAEPDAVWSIIGKPGSIADWHPAIQQSSLENTRRVCTLADGGKVFETILEHSDQSLSYRYRIDESPLPIQGYVSSLYVAKDGPGSTVTWDSEFQVVDAPAADVEGAIRGLYQAGLEHLQEMLETSR